MSAYPTFPPGMWRRIKLAPASGRIVAGLEDDVHRFRMTLDHVDGVITAATAITDRAPWSTCAGAGPYIAEELPGQRLADVARRDPSLHCTHLLDLAILAAAHAGDSAPIQFDMHVADRDAEERSTATYFENGASVIEWRIRGSLVENPGPWLGRDLRKLSQWQGDYSQADILRARTLRRTIFISSARRMSDMIHERAIDRQERMGVCYTYQEPHAADAVWLVGWRKDWSAGRTGPLSDFDPAEWLA